MGALYCIAMVVILIWIEEFHSHYHYGSMNHGKAIACMVIAFAAHLWFCICVCLFMSMVLFRVTVNRGSTTLLDPGSTDRLNKQELSAKVVEYMTRLAVLCMTALCVTMFCILMWIILLSTASPSHVFLRFCWWLFPINVFFAFLCIFLALNFDPQMNEIYMKVCCVPHHCFDAYCVRISKAKNGQSSGGREKIRDYEDDDDDEEEEVNHNNKEAEEEDESLSDLSDDEGTTINTSTR